MISSAVILNCYLCTRCDVAWAKEPFGQAPTKNCWNCELEDQTIECRWQQFGSEIRIFRPQLWQSGEMSEEDFYRPFNGLGQSPRLDAPRSSPSGYGTSSYGEGFYGYDESRAFFSDLYDDTEEETS